jgi:hypothetical protein
MNFDAVQPFLSGRITADADLALLGTPIQVDPFQDPEAAKSAIGNALRTTGVCFEVGFPWIGAPETLLGGTTHLEAVCEVFVAEHTQNAHTPSRATLVQRVISALTKPATGTQKPARLRASESVKTEDGYILHMMSFFIPMNIRQS